MPFGSADAVRATGKRIGPGLLGQPGTYASLLIATGADPKAIQERLGHASITTTLDRSGHLMPGLADALADALDDAHAAAAAPPSTTARLPAADQRQ